MSAALGSGQAALVRSAMPALNAQEVIDRIARTADRVSADDPPRVDPAAALGL